MHYCAVKMCGRNTKSPSLQNDAISFHRFPKCPKIKEKWIDATKRPNDWFPTQNSVICSRHFKTECFRVTECNNKRYLYPFAVPTLHLPTVISCEGSSEICQNTNVAASVVTPDLPTAVSKFTASDDSPNSQPATDILSSTSNSSSPRKNNRIIADLSFKLRQSKLKVKRLQTKNRVLEKKVMTLKSLLKELQDKQLIKN